jgi:predicted unusual protein kinase regulating ubiquinone biosynthesis (AarF/ABC1/UbiB family)
MAGDSDRRADDRRADDRRADARRVGAPVPTGRISRLARFGGLAAGVAGNMILGGARDLARGRRPSLPDLLLTPANALRVADGLANLRGAAMKLGQLMSMDAGDLLPPELTEILARLRADARPMPRAQVQAVLDRYWGPGWETRFAEFGWTPIAAASIGQVHRARLTCGRDVAIKVQYPGVRLSIDSDVDNVATLLAMSRLVPDGLDLAPLLAEAKRQLRDEADYLREADCLTRYRAALADDPDFTVPGLVEELARPAVLVMDYVAGIPIEAAETAPQAERDRLATALIRLVLDELFRFGLMQTDPNLANFLYDPATGRVILLDFGATRTIDPAMTEGYRTLGRAGLGGDEAAVWAAAESLGLVHPRVPAERKAEILALADMAMAPLRAGGRFDFADRGFAERMRDQGLAMAKRRELWHVPPAEALFVQRKLGGVYLIASRLGAVVDMGALVAPHL